MFLWFHDLEFVLRAYEIVWGGAQPWYYHDLWGQGLANIFLDNIRSVNSRYSFNNFSTTPPPPPYSHQKTSREAFQGKIYLSPLTITKDLWFLFLILTLLLNTFTVRRINFTIVMIYVTSMNLFSFDKLLIYNVHPQWW